MGRVPRKNMKDSSFFHIMVQGLNKEYIFNTKRDMKKYHEYAYKNSENIDILAYCLMNNHAHFLIYSDEIKNIGNWMKKTNTSYALYYNKKNDFELLENQNLDKQYICKSIVEDFLNNKKIKLRDLRFEKNLLKELVEILKIENKISYREIERNIGISKESLRKIINNGE